VGLAVRRMKLIIRLKQRAKMLAVTVALSTGCLVVALPVVAEAQHTDVTSVEADQNTKVNIDSATTEELQPAPEPSDRLIVDPGDSLWSICQRHLGPRATPQQIAIEVEQIFEINKNRIGNDPSLLMPGEELLLPSVSEPATTDPPADKPENTLEAGAPAASVSAESAAEQAASTASEPVEPAVGAFSKMPKASWLNERRLIGWGLLVLTPVLALFILWKKPMRRHVGREAWEPFTLANQQSPRKVSTNNVIGSHLVAPSQLRKGASGSAHQPWLNRQAEDHFYLDRNIHTRRKLLRRSETPLSRSRRERNGWATGVYDKQVRRALKRMAAFRSY
jgi:hypothetical protein